MRDDAAGTPGPDEPSSPPPPGGGDGGSSSFPGTGSAKNTGAANSTGAANNTGAAGCFGDLGVDGAVVRALRSLGATEPTPIQAAALPDALAGRDILGRAPTGSGKTLAFGIPIVERLSGAPSVPGRPRALVISPTRELAIQIADVLGDLGTAAGLRTVAFVGGENVSRQRTSLAAPVDVAVVTPGRAHDLRRQGLLELSDVALVVVDEADELAALGFLPDVIGLVRAVPAAAQRMLFSATLDEAALQLMEGRDAARHEVSKAVVSVDSMLHVVVRVPDNLAADFVLAAIACRRGRTVIFANTRQRVAGISKQFEHRGIAHGFLHGDRGQSARRQALADFASGKVTVLVATDVAARGIDVSDLDLVVHADPPPEAATYIHRSGRTARGGASGTVATLVRDRQVDEVTAMLAKAGVRPAVIDGFQPAARTGGGPRFTTALAEWTGARRPPPPGAGADGTPERRKARPVRQSRQHRPKRKRRGKK